jgi:hypothetical protein
MDNHFILTGISSFFSDLMLTSERVLVIILYTRSVCYTSIVFDSNPDYKDNCVVGD